MTSDVKVSDGMKAEHMWQDHPIFPDVPSEFWQSFRVRWAEPLRLLEEIISISESLAADPKSPRFDTMDNAYWVAFRMLYSRTCLHARSVLILLTNGLVDPATTQWRSCHESSTIASFIAKSPEMAARYLSYSDVNRYDLAKKHPTVGYEDVLTDLELEELKRRADAVKRDLKQVYGRQFPSGKYGWSGLRKFQEIETAVFEGQEWKPGVDYYLASERVHSDPNGVRPLEVGDGRYGFLVGPRNSGLANPAYLTSISIMVSTESLKWNASFTVDDEEKWKILLMKFRELEAIGWLRDPVFYCRKCGGHKFGDSPPVLIPEKKRPSPCRCQ